MSDRPTQPPSPEELERVAAFESLIKKAHPTAKKSLLRLLAVSWDMHNKINAVQRPDKE